MYIPQLSPYAFFIGPYGVHWYSLFMAFSMAVGIVYMVRVGTSEGAPLDTLYDLAFWAIIGGIVGARLVFVVTSHPGWFAHDPAQILRVWDGGLAWHGAVGGGMIVAWFYLRRHPEVNWWRVLDWMVFGLCVGIILVRVGNVFNHEILGRMTEFWFGRWPTQPMGSLVGVILLVRYLRLRKKNLPAGVQFWSAVFYYQLMRGCIVENFKADPLYWIHFHYAPWGIGLTTMTQLFTPPILAFAAYMWWRAAHLGRVTHEARALDRGSA